MLLDGTTPVDATAEALLMAADRAQHVGEVVEPALCSGAWVVTDRHLPSSLAYQGVGRGLGVDAVDAVNRLAVGGIEPDVVVVLDVDDGVATRRRAGRGAGPEGDRLEREAAAFHAAGAGRLSRPRRRTRLGRGRRRRHRGRRGGAGLGGRDGARVGS